ncbi:MAG: extracellular solute-binding protein, partial [Spirochaetia bacterium]|nr:extracellular solute-binding protein [Spirochaetia bacterium]
MKNLFLIILTALIIFTQVIMIRVGGSVLSGDKPYIYWVTDFHPSRKEQVRIFREWLKKNNYPDIEVRLDTANSGLQKTLIQAASGVAGDVIQVFGGAVPFLAEAGFVEDLASVTKEFKLNESELFIGADVDLYWNGGRYAVPKNVELRQYFVNRDLFEKLGMSPPPPNWNLEDFEKIGIEFDRRANAGKKRRQNFFANSISLEEVRKSAGISTYNETLTHLALDCPEYLAIMKRVEQFGNRYHIIPTDADRQDVAVGQGYGDSFFQLFNNGQLGLLLTGRWALIQIRSMGHNPRMTALGSPSQGFPVVIAQHGAIVTYKGSKRKEWAKYFQAFLFSEEYSRQILKDVDAFPPLTKYINDEEFLRPKGFPNEW